MSACRCWGGTPVLIKNGRYGACWSPDGSTIAVGSYLAGKVWFLDRLGHEQRAVSLQAIPWSIWDIDWSPRNGLLTIVSDDPYGEVHDLDGSAGRTRSDEDPLGGREIISTLGSRRRSPLLLFTPCEPDRFPVQDRGAVGSRKQQARSNELAHGPQVGPGICVVGGRTRLMYARDPYHTNLWMLDAPGTGRERSEWKQLTNGTSLMEGPRISPDGRLNRLQHRS